MSARGATEIDRLPDRFVERVAGWSFVAWILSTGPMWLLNQEAGAGIAIGGGVSVGSLVLYRAVVNTWVQPLRRRATRVALWMSALIKWPVIGVLFYVALKSGWVSPGWLCVGVGLVPAMAVTLVLRAVIADAWRARTAAGAAL